MNKRTLSLIAVVYALLTSLQAAHAAPTSPVPTPCAYPLAHTPRDLVVSFPSEYMKSDLRVSADGKVVTYRELQPATPETPQRTRHIQALLAHQMFLAGYSADFNSEMKSDIVCANSTLQPLTWASLGNDLQRQMAAASQRLSSLAPAPTSAQRSAFTTANNTLLTSLGQQRMAVATESGAVRYGVIVYGSFKNPIFLVIDFRQGILFGWNPTAGVIGKSRLTDSKINHYSKFRPLEKARFQSIITDLTDFTTKALRLSQQATIGELASWVGKEVTK